MINALFKGRVLALSIESRYYDYMMVKIDLVILNCNLENKKILLVNAFLS